jgi:transposase, IS5 family
MGKPRDERQKDLFRPALDQIIDMSHALVRLAQQIDWAFLESRFGSVYEPGAGRPPLPTRLMAGLAILKHMNALSDEVLCARWVENPYYQFFCGEHVFRHEAPFDRSSLTRSRQRMGEERLAALIQESLAVAHKTGAITGKDLERVAVDTTVQPKAVAHPSDARLMHRALIKLVVLARRNGVGLRQSYVRVAKRAAIMIGRYSHAHQFKRARRELRFLRARLGRVIRDIRRKIEGDAVLEERFGPLLALAVRVRSQDHRQRGAKVYALHAPEVECIGKGKLRTPYEFGCKVSLATPVTRPRGGQFVLHAKALHGNPFDGHTLGPVIADMEQLTGVEAKRIHVDKGYRGHSYANRFRVWISGQVRRVTKSIRREMRRRAAIEPVIGHLKDDHLMGRNHLKGREGDRINAVLASAGYNFRLLLRWLARIWRALMRIIVNVTILSVPTRQPHPA